jgi:hypothetical protein
MKKITVLLLFVTAVFSCSRDDESPFKDYKGKWILHPNDGNDSIHKRLVLICNGRNFMYWTLTEPLKNLGKKDGFVIEIQALITRLILQPVPCLDYSIDSEIIGSCSSELKEELNFQSENVLLNTCSNVVEGLKYEKSIKNKVKIVEFQLLVYFKSEITGLI